MCGWIHECKLLDMEGRLYKKNQTEMLQTKNTVTEMKKLDNVLTDKLNTIKGKVNLKMNQ